MARKKNKIAAGQERARQRARKKARYAGPTPAPESPAPDSTEADDVPEVETDDGTAEADQSQPVAAAPAAPAQTRRVPARTAREVTNIGATRHRQATQAISVAAGPSLRSEALRIGTVAAIVAVALVVLFFTTELGR